MRQVRAALSSGLLGLLAACGAAPQARVAAPHEAASPLERLHDSHWLWVETHCADDSPAREPSTAQRELHIRRSDEGLLLLADWKRPEAGCAATTAWQAQASTEHAGEWRLEPRAHVALPARSPCAGRPRARETAIRASRRTLELVDRSSARCGGLDARTVYRRIHTPSMSSERLLRHYMAHYNRRDAAALADLFADHGSLVEPFSAAPRPTRHEGWGKVRDWYASALGSVPWLALRPLRLEQGAEPGRYTLVWEYMDPWLREPMTGRNRFVVAAGEIFETELQILERPQPGATPPDS